MNETTATLIETMAAKLGTTAEYLWGVLVKQAPISSACAIASIAFWAVAMALLYRWIRVNTKKDENGDARWCDEACAFAWALWAIVLGVMILRAGVCMTNITTGFLNPEYWALKQLLPKGTN